MHEQTECHFGEIIVVIIMSVVAAAVVFVITGAIN